MRKFLDERGQSGTVFRLLIDGIIGLVILGLIISSLAYFQNLRISTSISNFYSLVDSAKESPNGIIFESDGSLIFLEGTGFTSTGLRNVTGLDDECFEFQSNLAFGKILGDGRQISFLQTVESRVYVKCFPTGDNCEYGEEDCCEIDCLISFGKKLEEGIP